MAPCFERLHGFYDWTLLCQGSDRRLGSAPLVGAMALVFQERSGRVSEKKNG
jgi:hypothetical protein